MMNAGNEEEVGSVDEGHGVFSEESEYYGPDDSEKSDFDGQYDHAITSIHGTSPEASGANDSKTPNFASQPSQTSRSRSRRGRPGGRALGYRPALGQYNDEYRKLLNGTISEAAGTIVGEDFANEELETSHLGVSLWTGPQKGAFFSALMRYGRDSLPKLAAAAEKSEPEVAHYLYLLETGLKELAAVTNRKHILGHEHIPAARELSDKCCESLQRAADALISLQESWEANEEQRKYGDYWLLDQTIADLIEDEVSHPPPKKDAEPERIHRKSEESERQQKSPSQESERQFILDSIPAARLLHLKTFINLSETFFMNSPDPEYDWNTYASPKHGPSIYHTAFNDFHSLAVNITRRIAHAAVFQAMTRSRAMDNRRSENPPKQNEVRRADVEAALEILGMKKNVKEYWATLPRRQGLRCYRLGSRRVDRERWVRRWIPVDEAEKYLKGDITKLRRKYPRECVVTRAGINGDRSASKHTQSDTEIVEEKEDIMPPRKRRRIEEDFLAKEAEETGYLESVDRRSSTAEERELWKMLDQTPPSNVNLKDIAVSEPPKTRSTEPDSSSDWREWFQYEPEWLHRVPNEDHKRTQVSRKQ